MELLAKDPPALSQYKAELGSLRTFVRTIADRTCYSKVARKTLPKSNESPDDLAAPDPGSEQRVIDRDLLEVVHDRLIRSVSPVDALIFKLAIVEGRGALEVSDQTGLSVSLIYLRKHRLRLKAQSILNELEDGVDVEHLEES